MAYTYKKGINLGGWMNCFEDLTHDYSWHLKTFITEADIDRIASWGADHVRLPFQNSVLNDETYDMMEQCVQWCNSRGLGVILDLHYLDGMTCNPLIKENPLFLPENQALFVRVWQDVSAHMGHHDDGVRYELLNEVTDGIGYLWNQLYPQGVRAIREREKERIIYVGSNRMNEVSCLVELRILEDEHLIYNFHYYAPHAFTHQRAPFDEDMRQFDHAYDYPCFFGDELYAYVRNHPDYVERCPGVLLTHNNRERLEKDLRAASDFVHYTGKPLYCGEFGVIETAEEASAVKWVRDMVDILRKKEIGYCYWCYKVRDFGIVDLQGNVRKPLLPDVLFKD